MIIYYNYRYIIKILTLDDLYDESIRSNREDGSRWEDEYLIVRLRIGESRSRN